MQLDKDNPWPGLASFEEDAHAFFFGRDHEIKLLHEHVLDTPVTVLYGCSGLGKTSLLQAGLFPLLRERHYLPIYIRFELKPGAAPLTRQLHHAVRDSIRADVPDAMLPSDDESLWEYLHRNDFELWNERNYPLTPVIVLDQFEELFTVGERVPDLVRAFRDDLGDLAENRIPAELAARIEDDEAVARRFNLRSRKYKLLISLREDYLPDLEGWRQLIPALRRSRVRLLHLQASDALAAVHKPAAHLMTVGLAQRVVAIVAGEDLHRGRETAEAEVDRAVDDLGASEVEPALLSLFCRELNEERKRRGQPQFDEQLIEDAKRDILSNYYSSCVRDLDPRVARFIESELITEKGFRNSYIREDAVPAHLTEDELDRLISSRLVRLEDRYGAPRIELTHDVLTRAVREHRDRRRADEEKAALAEAAEQAHEREQAAQAQAAAEERAKLEAQQQARMLLKRTRALRAALALAAIVAVVAVVGFGWAFIARNDAREQFRDATALRLYGDSQLALSGLRPGGSDDVLGMHMLLAALKIPSKHQGDRYPLLTALNQERDLLKVIDTPATALSVAFSPDGTRIASGGSDNIVHLWDANTGKEISQLHGQEDAVMSVAFSPDGTHIAAASSDLTIRLWDINTGKQIGQTLSGMNVTFSRDGTHIASGSPDGTIRLWDAVTGQPIGAPLRGHDKGVTSVAFSPDGRRIASGSFDKTVRLWDVTTGLPVGDPLKGHDDWVWNVAFSPDGKRIASASVDKTIRLWDVDSRQQIGEPLQHDGAVVSVSFSPDGARIASANYDGKVYLWDAASLREVGFLVGHRSAVESVAFSPDSLRLVSSADDDTVRIWNATSWQPILGHEDVAYAEFSDDGSHIDSGSRDKTVRRWDAKTGRPLTDALRVADDDVRTLFPVGEDRLLSLGSGNTVRMWDARTLKPIGNPLRFPPYPLEEIQPVVYTHETSRIAAETYPGLVELYNADTMQPIGDPISNDTLIWTIGFSHDGRIVATGDGDGRLRLWHSDTGKPIGQPMKHDGVINTLAFSPDGRLVAASYVDDRTLRLWDTQSFQPVGDPMRFDSGVSVATFSPDGRVVAAGGGDGSIRLWTVDDQTQLGAPLTVHKSAVSSLDFSPDGSKLLSASEDHKLRMSPAPNPSPDALCAKLTHDMSLGDWNKVVSPEIDYIKVCPELPDDDDSG